MEAGAAAWAGTCAMVAAAPAIGLVKLNSRTDSKMPEDVPALDSAIPRARM